jgi:hypothetical protein
MDKVKDALHLNSRKSKEDKAAALAGSSDNGMTHFYYPERMACGNACCLHTPIGFKAHVYFLYHNTMHTPHLSHSNQLTTTDTEGRTSYDSELEAMTPEERVRYLKEFEHAERHGEPKKGSFLDRLIMRGNKKTEDDLAAEAKLAEQARARRAAEGHVRPPAPAS